MRKKDAPDPLTRLVRTLAAADDPLDSRQVADALWLARWTKRPGDGAPPEAAPPSTPGERTDPAKTRSPGTDSPDEPDEPEGAGEASESGARGQTGGTGDARTGSEAAPDPSAARDTDRSESGALDFAAPSRRLRLPTAPGLPSLPALRRSLRALRAYRPAGSAVLSELDEVATAELTATTALVSPVRRPVRRRTADLYLLMDGAPAMAVWEGLLDELRRAFVQVGAFRDVVVQYLHPLGDGLGTTAQPGRGHVLRPAQELADPSGRRVHLLLSDCTGPLWRDGTFQRLLRDWAGSTPLAVVQPLPRRFWQRTALPAVAGVLTRRAGPYRALEFGPLHRGAADRSVPHVPVLTPTPAALSTWARLVSAEGGLRLRGAAAPLNDVPDTDRTPPAEPDDDEARRLVEEFDEAASPLARDLAVQLSAAPLSLPVMRLVQQTMQPDSGPGELAEVLLGGLVTEQPPVTGPGREQAARSGPWFDFRPRVRALLLRRLSAGEAALVLKHCALYIERTFGRDARNYPAVVVAYLEGTGRRPAHGTGSVPEPFVAVSDLVLRHFEQRLGALPGAAPRVPHPLGDAIGRLDRYEAKGSPDDLLEALRLLRVPGARAHPGWSGLYARALLHAWQEWRDPRQLAEAEEVARGEVETLARHPAPDAEALGAARLALARVLRAGGEEQVAEAARRRGPEADVERAAGERRVQEAMTQLEAAVEQRGLSPATLLACALLHTAVVNRRLGRSPDADLEPLDLSIELLGRLTEHWPVARPPAELWYALGRALLRRAQLAPADGPEQRALAGRAASALESGVRRTGGVSRTDVPPARALFDLAEAHALSDEPFRSPAEGEALKRASAAARAEGDRELEAAARGRLSVWLWKRDRAELETAEAEMKRALSLLRPGDPQRAELLVSYGQMLLDSRGDARDGAQGAPERGDDTNTVSEAVHSLREAVADTAPSHPSAAERRLLLARALRRRYGSEEMVADLYEACWTLELALRDTEGPALRAAAWLELGGLHRMLAQHTREREEWVRADEAYGRAVQEAEAARDPRTAARALHGRGEVLELLAGPARALALYRAARERWSRTPAADPDEVRRTDDRIRRLDGTQ
ncbi:SAV_2336 N-terminal domain-related protein [Streptomyces sp. NPDC102406]|uniref:SAV_2336 N-terminal domain-related protein n=1 Tax=Streptomyces sp. NPDC102406 TaxID=3366171 RepID=UPI0037F7EAAB